MEKAFEGNQYSLSETLSPAHYTPKVSYKSFMGMRCIVHPQLNTHKFSKQIVHHFSISGLLKYWKRHARFIFYETVYSPSHSRYHINQYTWGIGRSDAAAHSKKPHGGIRLYVLFWSVPLSGYGKINTIQSFSGFAGGRIDSNNQERCWKSQYCQTRRNWGSVSGPFEDDYGPCQ